MPSFLIIQPEPLNGQKAGRGARGRNLELFLKRYFGRRSVSLIGLEDLADKRSYSVDHLFLGIPSSITKNDLMKVSFERLHLFDYGDHEKVIWGHSDEGLLRPLASTYLKPWIQKSWGDEFKWGVLPVRRSGSLYLCAKASRFLQADEGQRNIDATFLGNPVVGWQETYGGELKYTRIHWLDEVASSGKHSLSGGFFMRGREAEQFRERASRTLSPLFLSKGRVNFLSYFSLMAHAKTALCPPGNALWSYRHYESIYAGALPISSDFREAEMLVPLPDDGMFHVGSGESVLPCLDEALKARKDNPNLATSNLESVEQYLTNGLYDRRKRLLLERFMMQIERS